MKQLLLTVKNKAGINDLEKYGNITYVSDYTALVGFECREEAIPQLIAHPNVLEFEDACTGSLQQ